MAHFGGQVERKISHMPRFRRFLPGTPMILGMGSKNVSAMPRLGTWRTYSLQKTYSLCPAWTKLPTYGIMDLEV